jgi:hypothetical protein
MDLHKTGNIPLYKNYRNDIKFLIDVQKVLKMYQIVNFNFLLKISIGRNDLVGKVAEYFNDKYEQNKKWPSWDDSKAEIALLLNGNNDLFKIFGETKPRLGQHLVNFNTEIEFLYLAIKRFKKKEYFMETYIDNITKVDHAFGLFTLLMYGNRNPKNLMKLMKIIEKLTAKDPYRFKVTSAQEKNGNGNKMEIKMEIKTEIKMKIKMEIKMEMEMKVNDNKELTILLDSTTHAMFAPITSHSAIESQNVLMPSRMAVMDSLIQISKSNKDLSMQ